MTTPQKAKGSQYERDVAKFLRENGHPYADRRYGAGNTQDKGDITGLGPRLVIECKNHKTLDLSGWLAEAEIERENAKAEYGVVVAKRRGKNAGESYVVMTLADFARLWKEANA
jgi:Holliday junction resolvase